MLYDFRTEVEILFTLLWDGVVQPVCRLNLAVTTYLHFVHCSLFCRERVVALGEIGLDYSQNNHVDHDIQKRTFLLQMNLALERDLAVCLHIRQGTIHKLR